MAVGAEPAMMWSVDDGELEAMPLSDLEDQITSFAGRIAAAMGMWLVWVAAFDRREGWTRWEQTSCAGWLNWKCGVSKRTAHEHVRVARSLESLPMLRRLMLAGEISYSKARAISRVATELNEAELCDLALAMTASQLEAVCAGLADRIPREPFTPTVSFESHGEWGRMVLSMPIDDMDRVRNCVYGAAEAVVAHAHRLAGDDVPIDETVASLGGLGAVRSEVSVGLLDGSVDAIEGPFEDAILVVDNDVLSSDEAGSGAEEDSADACGSCTLGNEVLPPLVAKRIACDARLQVGVEDAVGRALGDGREERVVGRKLRRRLHRRDRGMCRFPGCSTRRRLHAHHVIHWANGGPTELDNLILLCHRHHRSVHEGGWNIIDKNGRFVFYDPAGSERHVPRLGGLSPGVPIAETVPISDRPFTCAPLAGLGEPASIRSIVNDIAQATRLKQRRLAERECSAEHSGKSAPARDGQHESTAADAVEQRPKGLSTKLRQ
ncbi:MAG: DUF222 domain-containing protein [Acidimicrobiales bacterium]|nr:DUF222 domain-containing protein [Acidimicrobiales bacterium]